MRLYSLGSNGNHQLSLGHDRDVSEPSECILPDQLTHQRAPSQDLSIACGGNHTLLLTRDGHLYACGTNEHGQLGIHDSSLPLLTRIHPNLRWKLVSCGFDFTVLVTHDDQVYVCGRNDKGALGLGSIKQTTTLQRVVLDIGQRQVVDVKASLNHVVMVLSDNSIYGWGSTRKSALGVSHDSDTLNVPALLNLMPHTELFGLLSLGKDWTCLLTDITTHCHGPSRDRWAVQPWNVNVDTVNMMCSNWSSLHFLYHDGSITSHGRNDRGQFAPSKCPPIKMLASGSEHSVALGHDGKVYVWGWNEHGNCGPGTDDVTTVRTLEVQGDVVGIAAGYGTTFIWCRD